MQPSALLLAGYFLIGSMIPRTDFSQLMHLNDLVEHYHLHVEEALAEGESISFSAFLYLHFVNPEDHKHDHEDEHDGLPMHSISSSVAYVCSSAMDLEGAMVLPSCALDRSYLNVFYLQGYLAAISHPPAA